jgi:hypothetical protein
MCVLLVFGASIGVTPAAQPEPLAELRAAQVLGWDIAALLAQGLAGSDAKRFPGLHAWLKDYRAAGGVPGKRLGSGTLPRLDPERLVTRNPNFWRAYFEMAPADSGAMLLHASLLLAAGEASRAAYILVIARQNPQIARETLQAMDNLLQHAQALIARGAQQVSAAAKQHDEGQPGAAGKQLRDALAAWPRNALAHYELALTLLAQQYADQGRPAPSRARLGIHSELAPAGATLAAFTDARLHDPLLIRAYVGNDRETANALIALGKKVRPLWEAIARDTQAETRDETLSDLAAALQDAGIHELAIALGQVVFGREGGYDDDDRKFIQASLRELAPSALDAVMKRIGSARPEFARIVLP